MAQTLMGKIKILISATLHSIVDQALSTNSLGVFDEYIRESERTMETVRATLIDLSASVKMLSRKYDETSKLSASLDMQVDAALKANKTVLAKATQSKLNSELEIAHTYKDQYDKQSAALSTMQQVVDVLQSKVDILKNQRDQVAVLIQLAKSKGILAKSINDIRDISDNRTQSIVENVKSKLDTEDARLEVATSRLSDQIDNAVSNTDLDAQLEQRRQRLGL